MALAKVQHRRVLITGATGFIGSHVAGRLVKEGFEVAIMKRLTSSTHKVEGILNRLAVYNAELSSAEDVQKTIVDFYPDVVIHFATQYSVAQKPGCVSAMVTTNVLGTVNLLEAAKNNGVKLFINTSSYFVYALCQNKISEDYPCRPLNLYALTKMQAKEACAFYAGQYGLPCVTMRIFSPYGPGDHERRLIPYLINSFLSDEAPKMTTGKQQWDFVYIDDIVEAYVNVLNMSSFSAKHEIFNVGSGESISVHDIVLRLREILGSRLTPQWGALPHRSDEIWHICADINKAKDRLGWVPRTKILDKGLSLTADCFKAGHVKKDRSIKA